MTEKLKIKKKKKKNPDYKKLYPEAGKRTSEGQRQMKERIKHGDMHLHYGFPDTAEGIKRYQDSKKKYGLN